MISAWFGLIRRCPARNFCRVEIRKYRALDRISERLRRFGYSSNHFAGFRRDRCVTIQGTPSTPIFWGRGACTCYSSPAADRLLQFPGALSDVIAPSYCTVMAAGSDQAGGKSSTGIEPLVARNRPIRTRAIQGVAVKDSVQRFVHSENIAYYKRLIVESERDPSRDEARHQMLLRLLAEELARNTISQTDKRFAASRRG
jgi:hypothetical protein